MKKTLIIAMCCIVALMTACKKKPVEPTPEPDPEPIDYVEQYVGSYLGGFLLTVSSMNNEAVTNMIFPIDNIGMVVTKGEATDAVTATVTVENESHHTNGIVTKEKADFEAVHLIIDKPDQFYMFELDLKMEGTKAVSDTLNITGTFAGNGVFTYNGIENVLDEVSGTLRGMLVSQPTPENQ